MIITRVLFCFVGFLCFSSSLQQEQVRVVLYYESLCPYCHEFIVEQFYPGYQKLEKYISLDLVPFGKAYLNTSLDGFEWVCQHGPVECYLNKVHACAINLNISQSQTFDYINCLTVGSNRNTTQEQAEVLAQKCSSDTKILWSSISKCLEDGTADKLFLEYEHRQKELDPPITYVPNIRFNDVADEDLENLARFDFVYTICQLISNSATEVCEDV